MRLAFDPISHVYSIDNKHVPSVTQILKTAGLYSDFSFADPVHRFRGSAVHAACAFLDFGLPVQIEAPPQYQQIVDDIKNGYCVAFQRWKDRTKFQGACWEAPLISAEQGYGGCFDAAGRFGDSPEIVLVDLKSGVMPLMVAAQLAGYLELVQRGECVNSDHPGWQWLQESVRMGVPVRRVAVRLDKTGKDTQFTETADGMPFDAPYWTLAWRAAANLYNVRSKFKLL